MRKAEAGGNGTLAGERSLAAAGCHNTACSTCLCMLAHSHDAKTSRDDTSFCSDELTQILSRMSAPHIHIPRIGHPGMQRSRSAGFFAFSFCMRTAPIACMVLHCIPRRWMNGKWARFHRLLFLAD